MNKFYITSAIPYVNARPHIGHALEFVQADTVARFQKLAGNEVLYLCGSDENALKNVQAAEKEGISPQELVDKNAKLFEELAKELDVNFDVFQKGSSKDHHKSSQKLWELCSHDIYKKKYKGLYCVGCELFYTPAELNENGECYEHPGKKLEEVEEENYFFKLSKYQEQLLKLIEKGELEIVPEFRKNEVVQFIKQGLEDFSVSRSNERAKNWGVSVPNDPSQRIYVWFDALNIYQSGIGFGADEKRYEQWWPADLHVIGKGITRFHAIYWPAILLSANLKLPRKIFVHEYINVEGQKMSKTLGNVVDPIELIGKYGKDPLRYYLLAKVSPFQDGDFSEEKLKEAYNSDLANGLGNLVARVAKLCEKINLESTKTNPSLDQNIKTLFDEFKFNEAIETVWLKIKELDQRINQKEPWKLNDSDLKSELEIYTSQILDIAFNLQPFLPETSRKIFEQFKGPKIKAAEPLFPRI
jgi:methionyl-tRNA synthetase